MRKIVTFLTLLVMFAVSFLVTRVAKEGAIAPSDNQVVSMQLNSTLWGIRQALAGAPGAYIMSRGDCMLFMWQIEDAWAFAGINIEKAQAMRELAVISKGNVVNVNTMSDMVKWLEEGGWKVVPSAGLSEATRLFISASLSYTASAMPTFLVLPAGMFLPDESLDKYRLVEEWQ